MTVAVPKRDLVVIGGLAGAIEALAKITSEQPADLPAAILIVIHVPPTAESMLAQILARHCLLRVVGAEDGALIEPGHVYVAARDKHLLVHGDHIRLSAGPRENRYRPAIDPLFRSAARWGGPRVIAVALSGALDDGSAGALAVKMRGGL